MDGNPPTSGPWDVLYAHADGPMSQQQRFDLPHGGWQPAAAIQQPRAPVLSDGHLQHAHSAPYTSPFQGYMDNALGSEISLSAAGPQPLSEPQRSPDPCQRGELPYGTQLLTDGEWWGGMLIDVAPKPAGAHSTSPSGNSSPAPPEALLSSVCMIPAAEDATPQQASARYTMPPLHIAGTHSSDSSQLEQQYGLGHFRAAAAAATSSAATFTSGDIGMPSNAAQVAAPPDTSPQLQPPAVFNTASPNSDSPAAVRPQRRRGPITIQLERAFSDPQVTTRPRCGVSRGGSKLASPATAVDPEKLDAICRSHQRKLELNRQQQAASRERKKAKAADNKARTQQLQQQKAAARSQVAALQAANAALEARCAQLPPSLDGQADLQQGPAFRLDAVAPEAVAAVASCAEACGVAAAAWLQQQGQSTFEDLQRLSQVVMACLQHLAHDSGRTEVLTALVTALGQIARALWQRQPRMAQALAAAMPLRGTGNLAEGSLPPAMREQQTTALLERMQLSLQQRQNLAALLETLRQGSELHRRRKWRLLQQLHAGSTAALTDAGSIATLTHASEAVEAAEGLAVHGASLHLQFLLGFYTDILTPTQAARLLVEAHPSVPDLPSICRQAAAML